MQPTHVGLVEPGEAEAGLQAAPAAGRSPDHEAVVVTCSGHPREAGDVTQGTGGFKVSKKTRVGGHSPAHPTKAAVLELCSVPLPAGPGRKGSRGLASCRATVLLSRRGWPISW